MASPLIYTSGAGGTTGDALVTSSPLWTFNSARVWYVYSGTGVDAASPAGRQREKPLATTAQAFTNAAPGDIICYLAGHVEAIGILGSMGKANIVQVSEGTGTSRARFTSNVADVMWEYTGAGCQLRNLYFPASTIAPVGARVQSRAASFLLKDCYFECGALDTVPAFRTAAGSAQFRAQGTTFVATASQPSVGLELTVAVANPEILNCTFDGSSFGFSSYALNGAAAATGLRGEGNQLLNNADAIFATGTTGYWYPGSSSGSAVFEATA